VILSDEIKAKLKAATLEELEHWAGCVLSAQSLDAVFG